MTLLCHFPGCRILRVMRDSPNSLLVAAEARRDASRCPACRTLSTSVPSRDHRQPADRPVSGQAIRLRLTIRRFSCRNPSCPRRTFAEQLPHRLGRHAQRTRRLAQAQVQTALALGGAPAARLLSHLAMPASPTTLLQAIRRLPLPAQGRPSLVGVDDWAFVDLARRFCDIVRRAGLREQQDGSSPKAFDAWLVEARRCGVRGVESFAASLDQDGAAVRAALTLPWSSGQAEGQINRLKLLKRAMYGRAKLDWLRRRFLLAA